MQHRYGKMTTSFSLLALALTLGACSQPSTPTPTTTAPPVTTTPSTTTTPTTTPPVAADPFQSFKDQKLVWATCDPTLVPFGPRTRKALEGRVQCADVKVPLDWNNAARGTISIGLLRATAANPAKRQGSIFFNPGGPGGDGLLFGAIFASLWTRADTSTPAGVALKTLSDQYDMIGFSPRGTGQSTRFTCGSNEIFSPEQDAAEDRSPKNLTALARNARLVAQACLKNPIVPYINTDQTARDLDLTRQLLGDAKFNYIGYSYGTWLGAWYAKLFPQNAGRMLLDGNVAFAGDYEKGALLKPQSFERAFRDSALAYAARHPEFELGSTKEQVYALYNSFPSAVKYAVKNYSNGITGALYTDEGITKIPLSLMGARGLSAVIAAYPELNTVEDLAPRLDQYFYSEDPDIEAAAHAESLAMLGTYLDVVNGGTGPVSLSYGSSVLTAVRNNDTPWTQSQQFWIDQGNKDAVKYPLTGGEIPTAVFWGQPTTSRPPVPANMPPILMLQNELDPTTHKEGALEALNSLPSAKMIFVDNEAQHTAFPYGDQCVDLQVANYFLSGTLPDKKFNVCQAKPLPGEDQVYPVGDSYATGDLIPAQSLGRSAFSDPDAAAELGQIKAIIKRNAIKPRF